MTLRSNQKCTPVIGAILILLKFASGFGAANTFGHQFEQRVMGHGEYVGVGGFFPAGVELKAA